MAIFNSYVKLPEGTHPEYLQLRRFHYGSGDESRTYLLQTTIRHTASPASSCQAWLQSDSEHCREAVCSARADSFWGKIRVNSCGIAFLVGKSIRFRLIETSDYQMILDDAKVRQSQHNITSIHNTTKKTSKNP